jgi:hypothetical protein
MTRFSAIAATNEIRTSLGICLTSIRGQVLYITLLYNPAPMIDNTEILAGSKGIVNCKCLSESQNMISLSDSTNGKFRTRPGNSRTPGIADHRPATV